MRTLFLGSRGWTLPLPRPIVDEYRFLIKSVFKVAFGVADTPELYTDQYRVRHSARRQIPGSIDVQSDRWTPEPITAEYRFQYRVLHGGTPEGTRNPTAPLPAAPGGAAHIRVDR